MYRIDLSAKSLLLTWQGTPLEWDYSEMKFQKMKDGTQYRKDFAFDVGGRAIFGWVGILDKGSRSKAGFSILHSDRVVKGWPDAWRPEPIFGQLLGSNDLVNQRLVGEVHLDSFDVSQTKDTVLWGELDEEDIGERLRVECADYIAVAKVPRKGKQDSRGPSELDVQLAVEEVQEESSSNEIIDLLNLTAVPPPAVVAAGFKPLSEVVAGQEPDLRANVGPVAVTVYLANDASLNDPYVLVDAASDERVEVVVNMQHPYIRQIAADGFLNHLRHCVYDALAEWQARHLASRLEPDSIKFLKDRLLRLPFDMERHAGPEADVELGVVSE